MTSIITRKDAKNLGLKRYFTGKACVYGHVFFRFVRNGQCVECANIRLNEWRKKNPEIRAAHRKKHKELHRERENKSHKDWLNADADRKERYRIQKNKASLVWAKNNKAKRQFALSEYRARKNNRSPSWLSEADLFEIRCIYNYCSSLNDSGLKYHVDHIIPLKGDIVSGLHVPLNLQVIPAIENIRKNNVWNG